MTKIGFYAGSFSPVTRGHLGIICEALNDYDQVIVGVGVNEGKQQLYLPEERAEMVHKSLDDLLFEYEYRDLIGIKYSRSEHSALERLANSPDCVKVVSYKGLTVDEALKQGATSLIRGERIVGDHDSEMQISVLNKQILEVRKAHLNMATIPVPREDMTYISSSNARTLFAINEYIAAMRYITPSVHAYIMGRKLSERYINLLKQCNISKLRSIEQYNALISAYNTHRKHHSLSHLAYMFNYWQIAEDLGLAQAENETTLALAIFYHDFVNEGNVDDEALSCKQLKEVGISSSLRSQVEKLIMATQHGALPEEMSADMKLIHDLDLAILGDTTNYGYYAAHIRWEYGKYDEEAYKKGRIEVLKNLLSSKPLFLLPEFAKLFEEDARANIQKEIAYWQSK